MDSDLSFSEFEKYYKNLNDSERRQLAKAVSGYKCAPQPGAQLDAFKSKADILGYGGAAGGGKAEPNYMIIKGIFGDVPIGDAKIGSEICTVYGTTTHVIAKKHFTNRNCYKISFADGTSIDVDEDHLNIAFRLRKPRKEHNHPDADQYGRIYGPKSSLIYTVGGLLKEMDKGSKMAVPIPLPTAGNYNKFRVDPYMLGAMLGDGCMVNGGFTISAHKDDVQVLNRIKENMYHFTIRKQGENKNTIIGYLHRDDIQRRRLIDLGVTGKYSYEKHLPKSACFAPVEWRWALMQGLMDTDGWVEEKRCAHFSTTSKQLRDDVAELARSLGCLASYTTKKPTYTYNGERRTGREAYTLRIKSETPEKLFSLERKVNIAKGIKHQSLAKEIVDIKPIGKHDTTCIQVRHPSGLYLTNHYTMTHNSSLIALLAVMAHKRTVIFRDDANQMQQIIGDLKKFAGEPHNYQFSSQNKRMYILKSGKQDKLIEWGGLSKPDSVNDWRGREHDLVAFDEVTDLDEKKVREVMAWNRTAEQNQRCRVIMTFNPPGSPTTGIDDAGVTSNKDYGRWVIRFFAPWIDKNYEGVRAAPGELRWFYVDGEGKEIEVKDGSEQPIIVGGKHLAVKDRITGKEVLQYAKPLSRTFIPARVFDNKYFTGNRVYINQLASLPEPYRSRLLDGNMDYEDVDNYSQLIPGTWVEDAMRRWDKDDFKASRPASIGVDVGYRRDATVMVERHSHKFNNFHIAKSLSTGRDVASEILKYSSRHSPKPPVCIDAVGVSKSAYDALKEVYHDNGIEKEVVPVFGQAQKMLVNTYDNIKHYNQRAALFWLLRRILDPENGCAATLPRDDELKEELTAIKFDIKPNGHKITDKKELRIALQRSPDKADAVAYSLMNYHKTNGRIGGQVEEELAAYVPQKRHAFRNRNSWMI